MQGENTLFNYAAKERELATSFWSSVKKANEILCCTQEYAMTIKKGVSF